MNLSVSPRAACGVRFPFQGEKIMMTFCKEHLCTEAGPALRFPELEEEIVSGRIWIYLHTPLNSCSSAQFSLCGFLHVKALFLL